MRGHGDELSRRGVTSCEMLMIYRYSCVELLSVRLRPVSCELRESLSVHSVFIRVCCTCGVVVETFYVYTGRGAHSVL